MSRPKCSPGRECLERAKRCAFNARLPTRITGGPFHNTLRAGTYGDVYDEIPWKVAFGLAQDLGRDPNDRSSRVCSYNPTHVLLHNWVETNRDREVIKFRRRPPLSQHGWFYTTTYDGSYNRRRCEKERLFLQKIKAFPIGVYPGHQRELNVDMLCMCASNPELCVLQDQKEKCEKCLQRQKRFDKEDPPKEEEPNYEICRS